VAKQVSFCDRAWLRLGRVIGYVYDGNGEVFPAVVQAFSIARIAPSTRYRVERLYLRFCLLSTVQRQLKPLSELHS